MTGVDQTIAWSLVAVGLGGSALWSGMETGLYSLNRVRLRVRAGGDHPVPAARRLHHELSQPDRALTTLLIGNNVCNYMGALGVTSLLSMMDLPEAAIVALQAIVLTPVLLVFGEALPKEIFRRNADPLLERLAPVLVALRWFSTATLVLPIVLAFVRFAAARAGTSGIGAVSTGRRRIAELLKEGLPTPVLSTHQSTLIDRALRFTQAVVGSEMVAIRSARTVRSDWDNARARIESDRSGMSRYPVLDRTGRVVGILTALELYLQPDAGVRELMRPAVVFEPATKAGDALSRLKQAGARLGIVERDGRPLGIVTAKDLVEPLTGELADW